MPFEMSDKERHQAGVWINEQLRKKDCYTGACGGRFSYIFTPTSIGMAVEIEDNVLHEKCNVTDYDNW